ncbi:MAG: hypothetical protein K2X87_12910, partial [Gemmataceae bacterium]|nr:hypothetical protein [Gemmataceae bacterium]
PAGGVIPVYGPPGDRIADMPPLAPGDVLKAGTPVATLASRDQRAADVKVAEVQLEEAKAALAAAKEAGGKKIAAAQAEADQLAANETADLAALDARIGLAAKQREAAARQLSRLEGLRGRAPVADEDLEKARLAVAQAEAEGTAADAARAKAATSYAEGKKAAAARIAAAKAELAEAEARAPIRSGEERLTAARKALDLTALKAPVDGVVLRVAGRPGQPTGIDPVIQMANLGEMVAVAEVYEADVEKVVGWLRAGPVATEVTNPALPGPLKGVVRGEADVSRMIARNAVFPAGPREDADRRVVEVTAHLDPASASAAARFVGLQVTVTLTPTK